MNYERKVEAMDSLAGSTPSFYDEGESRRKRTRLIVALVLIGLALAATWYAFTHRGTGAATAEGADGAAAQSIPNVTVVIPGGCRCRRRSPRTARSPRAAKCPSGSRARAAR